MSKIPFALMGSGGLICCGFVCVALYKRVHNFLGLF